MLWCENVKCEIMRAHVLPLMDVLCVRHLMAVFWQPCSAESACSTGGRQTLYVLYNEQNTNIKIPKRKRCCCFVLVCIYIDMSLVKPIHKTECVVVSGNPPHTTPLLNIRFNIWLTYAYKTYSKAHVQIVSCYKTKYIAIKLNVWLSSCH